MSDSSDGDGIHTQFVAYHAKRVIKQEHAQKAMEQDQAAAFRHELGTFNRENVLAASDVGDDYLRMRRRPTSSNRPTCHVTDSDNVVLAGWKNFHLTTTDRDIDAERQDRLHDGQLFRLNRQARGEVLQHPKRHQHGQNGDRFGPPSRKNEQHLPDILHNPGQNVDPLALAKAMQFKGSYSGRSRSRAPGNVPNTFAPNGPAARGGHSVRGRGSFTPSTPGPRESLNPHADIHADQGMPTPGRVSRNQNSSAVRGGNSNSAPPVLGKHAGKGSVASAKTTTYGEPTPTRNGRDRNGTSVQQNIVSTMRGTSSRRTPTAPMMDRSNSSMSNTTRASSTVASTSSGAVVATSNRPPQPTGKLASPEDFMAAAKSKGIHASKYAPKDKDESKGKGEQPKTISNTKAGLSGSKYAS